MIYFVWTLSCNKIEYQFGGKDEVTSYPTLRTIASAPLVGSSSRLPVCNLELINREHFSMNRYFKERSSYENHFCPTCFFVVSKERVDEHSLENLRCSVWDRITHDEHFERARRVLWFLKTKKQNLKMVRLRDVKDTIFNYLCHIPNRALSLCSVSKVNKRPVKHIWNAFLTFQFFIVCGQVWFSRIIWFSRDAILW